MRGGCSIFCPNGRLHSACRYTRKTSIVHVTFISHSFPTFCLSMPCFCCSRLCIYASKIGQFLAHWCGLLMALNLKLFLVVTISLILCCIVYTLTGTFGYLTFGEDVNNDILVSYSATDPLVIAARVLMAVAMITSYPILHFCGRAAFFSITGLDAFDLNITAEQKRKIELRRRVVATCIWFLTALMLAIFIPNITDVISVIGSLAAFFILIFPGLIIMQLIVDDRINWHKR